MSFVNELLNGMNFQTKPTKNYPWDVVVDACYFRLHGPRADNKVWQATITGTVKVTLCFHAFRGNSNLFILMKYNMVNHVNP